MNRKSNAIISDDYLVFASFILKMSVSFACECECVCHVESMERSHLNQMKGEKAMSNTLSLVEIEFNLFWECIFQ